MSEGEISGVSNWRKLKRLLQFVHCTIHDNLTLSADDVTFMTTWVDASYAVHDDIHSHTGGCMSFGSRMIHYKSLKKKLNTKSSTECEVVGASDYIPFTMYMKYFIEAQGYKARKHDFNQDNRSFMKLEKNGRASSGHKTRHINIRYFFMKAIIKQDEINIVYYPTEIMIVNCFTKPLQSALFKKLRSIIMG